MQKQVYESRGYLHEEFRLFHLRDAMEEVLDWHYHAFHKIIVFLSGQASYGIEGKSYPLEPGDIVLVGQGCIHRPEVLPGAPYERVILYISPEFLRHNSTQECALETCFTQAKESFSFVVRPKRQREGIMQALSALEQAQHQPGFGQEIYLKALFFQFLISLSRGMQEHTLQYTNASVCDEKIVAILQYLSSHLTEHVSIDDLASQFYISKYHMMRRFRAQTGYTIHSYLISKRLMLARDLIAGGKPVAEACYASGFGDYSTFSRAYRKQFGQPPSAAK